MKVEIIDLQKISRKRFVELALSMYVGEKCKYCLHEYTSNEDLREHKVVFAGYHEHGRLACKKCFDEHNPPASHQVKGE